MNEKERQAIILGALLHDVGKFMQRAEVPLTKPEHIEGMICPVYQGRYSHRHVLWTDEFFEKYMPQEFSNAANFARYHHRPANELQQIIQEADRLSSGERKEKYYEEEITGVDSFKRIRLHSIKEYVSISEHRYLLENQYTEMVDKI